MIEFIALSGFLGAGKTTTMMAARRLLQSRGRRVAVITNDQGSDLVDTQLVQADGAGSGSGEVTGGCFCCRFENLVDVASALISNDGVETIIAEAVGSCTDLHATVVRPLQRYYGDEFAVAPLTTVVDPRRYSAFSRSWDGEQPESDMAYLFRHQLGEASVIGLNKIDVISLKEAARTLADLERRFPNAAVIAYSAATGTGIEDLAAAWSQPRGTGQSPDLDYDRYAAAEAELAWLNLTLDATATDGTTFRPSEWATIVLDTLAAACARADHLIGHAKVTVATPRGMAKASITGADQLASLDLAVPGAVESGLVTFNARIACDPGKLEALVRTAVEVADSAAGARSTIGQGRAFRPGYPRPVHRLVT